MTNIIRNGMFTLISLFLVGISQLIFNVAIARAFGSEVLGEVNVVISAALLLSMIVSSGINPANSKYVSEFRGKKKSEDASVTFSLSLFLTIVLSTSIIFISMILGPSLNSWFGISGNQLIFVLPLVIFYATYLLLKGMYYAVNRIREYILIEIISRLLFFITLAYVVLRNENLPLPFILVYGIFSLISIITLRKHIVFSWSSNVAKKVVAFSLVSFVGTFSSLARTRLSLIVPALYLSKEDIGLFAAVFSLFTIFYYLPRAITLVMSPMISYSYGANDEKTIIKTLNMTNKYLTIYTILFTGIVGLMSSPILTILFGDSFKAATLSLQLISVSAFFTVYAIPSVNTLVATKHVHIPNIGGVAGLITSLISWYLLIPAIGIDGIAIGFLAGTIVNSAIPIIYTRKHFKPKPTVGIVIKGVGALIPAVIVSRWEIAASVLFMIIFTALNLKDIKHFAGTIINETRVKKVNL